MNYQDIEVPLLMKKLSCVGPKVNNRRGFSIVVCISRFLGKLKLISENLRTV